MRLFTAFTPPEPVIAEWLRLQDALKASLVARRFEFLDNAHVTMHFLGELPGESLETLDACLREAVQELAPFEVSLGTLGGFPNATHPRVVFIELASPAIAQVQATLAAALANTCLYQPEARLYVPHLTLLRDPADPRGAAEQMRTLAVEKLAWRVDGFNLVRSRTTPEGAHYTSLAHYAFQKIARTTL